MASDSAVNCVELPDGIIKYLRFGGGKQNLVIISGLSYSDIFENVAIIENAYKIFGDDYTVYLFERREIVAPNSSIENMAEDIVFALNSLGIKKADFLGVSQGGMIAQVIASKYPSLINALVLTSTAARIDSGDNNAVNRWISLAKQGKIKELAEDFYKSIFSRDFYTKYKSFFDKVIFSDDKQSIKRFITLSKACLDFDGEKYLSEIKCPSFVIASRDDAVIPFKATKRLAKKIGAKFFAYKGYGHAVYDAAPDYKNRVLAFLNNKNA